jgi:2-oxoisovalerate ferredoxin oxidoreductase beta subunit
MPEVDYALVHGRSPSFYPSFFRKSELPHQTHYCPGCGHGVIHKLVAEALDGLAVQDRTILVSPVGCSVFAYYYFDVGNIQAAHGRASAVATAAKRARPESIVISYQGDGDLAAIGSAEILHAANRGENITVIFVNNAIYGMTGGQMAPTTLLGQYSTTAPLGRTISEGYPLHVCELLATLEAPVYLERVALSDNKHIMQAKRAIHKAIENQVRGLGFSLVEVLSPCPTIWKKDPTAAQRWVREELSKAFPPGVYKDRTKEVTPRPAAPAPASLEAIPSLLGIERRVDQFARPAQDIDLRIRVAGFGGQGVLLLGEVLAEAALASGLEVSWLPSYGPEMRSGTSNCHVRLSSHAIDSPLVTKPNVLLALNEPSLRKFLPSVEAGGWVFYNGDALPEDCRRTDVQIVVNSFTRLADTLGDPRAGNMVMLGKMLGMVGALPREAVDHSLRLLVKSERWIELDTRAISCGAGLP